MPHQGLLPLNAVAWTDDDFQIALGAPGDLLALHAHRLLSKYPRLDHDPFEVGEPDTPSRSRHCPPGLMQALPPGWPATVQATRFSLCPRSLAEVAPLERKALAACRRLGRRRLGGSGLGRRHQGDAVSAGRAVDPRLLRLIRCQ